MVNLKIVPYTFHDQHFHSECFAVDRHDLFAYFLDTYKNAQFFD